MRGEGAESMGGGGVGIKSVVLVRVGHINTYSDERELKVNNKKRDMFTFGVWSFVVSCIGLALSSNFP